MSIATRVKLSNKNKLWVGLIYTIHLAFTYLESFPFLTIWHCCISLETGRSRKELLIKSKEDNTFRRSLYLKVETLARLVCGSSLYFRQSRSQTELNNLLPVSSIMTFLKIKLNILVTFLTI